MYTINERYQLKLKLYKRLSHWVGPDPFGLNLFLNAHMDHRFSPLLRYELEQKHKQVFPRRRKINLDNLPDHVRQAANNKVVSVALVYYEDRIYTCARLKRQLKELTRELDMTPYEPDFPLYRVYRCNLSTYSTQTNSHGYAHANAKQKAELLEKFGFTTEVRAITWFDEFGEGKLRKGWPHSYEVDYRNVTYAFDVYANCEEYHLDACERMDGTTMLEWAVDCWRKGTNPKVYYPWLSDEVYDESMAIHMGKADPDKYKDMPTYPRRKCGKPTKEAT